MPPIFRIGRIAIAKIIIPIPPSHCNIALQVNNPLERLSTLLYILAPVVVKPEVASKKASENFVIFLSKKNGRLAKKHNTGRERTVIIMVSLTLIFLSLLLNANIKHNPMKEEIKKLGKKTDNLL